MSVTFHTVFLLLFPSFLFAQVFSREDRFSVPFAKGCAPFEVTVSEHDTFGNITRQYFYEDEVSETIAKSYTYNTPGVYKIIQVVGIDVVPKTDTLTIEVFEISEPKVEMERCSNLGVTVTSTDQTYDFIRVYFSTNDSISLEKGQSGSYTYSGTNTQSFRTQGFYLNAQENCSSFSQTITPLSNLTVPIVTSASVKETCLESFALILNLEGSDVWINYQVEFSQISSSIIYSGPIESGRLVIPDIGFQSGTPYCVKVNAIDRCASNIVRGTSFCAEISDLMLTPFAGLYSSYQENGIFINLETISSGSLLIYRKLEDGDFEFRNSVQTAYIDPIGSLARRYTYRIDYLDSCSQILSVAETNPPLISSKRLEDNSYIVDYISPTNAISTTSDVVYSVGNKVTSTAAIASEDFELRLSPENGTRQILQLMVTYSNGLILHSNRLILKYVPFIHVPGAFTPNGDGMNDTLELFGLPTTTVTTNIYSRWDLLIYTSDKRNSGWDGLINGNPAPEGVYLYEVIFMTREGEKIRQRGTFALLKK